MATADRRIGAFLAIVALSLAIASILHLSGNIHGSEPFDPDHAGIAEAVIAVVLAGGAIALLRGVAHARTIGIAAIGFAIIGFLVGLNFTVRGGHLPDVAYHLTVLPLLVVSLVIILRQGRSADRYPVKRGRDDRHGEESRLA